MIKTISLVTLALFVSEPTGALFSQSWKDLVPSSTKAIIIENKDDLSLKTAILSLREELRLKGPGPNAPFGLIQAVDADQKGRIIVLDKKECRLYRFDAKGVLINTFGKQGQGPGELERPFGLSVNSRDQQIIVYSLNFKMTVFSYDGRFLQEENLHTGATKSIKRDSKRALIWTEISTNPQDPLSKLMKKDPATDSARILATFPAPFRQNIIIPFSPVSSLGVDAADRVYFGFPTKFEILRFDGDGRLERVITQAFHPVELSVREKSEKAKEFPPDIPIEFPKYHSAYMNFLVSDEGAIIVKTWEKKDSAVQCVFYDPDGRCAGKVWLRGEPVLLKAKKLFVLEEDGNGEQALVQYAVNINGNLWFVVEAATRCGQ